MRHTSVAGELSGSKVHSLKTSVRLPVISLSRQVPQLQGGKGGTPRGWRVTVSLPSRGEGVRLSGCSRPHTPTVHVSLHPRPAQLPLPLLLFLPLKFLGSL